MPDVSSQDIGCVILRSFFCLLLLSTDVPGHVYYLLSYDAPFMPSCPLTPNCYVLTYS